MNLLKPMPLPAILSVPSRRWLRLLGLALLGLVVGGCGFHLRHSVALPASMQTLAVEVNGGGELKRQLVLALKASGATVVDAATPGAAQLKVPVASYRTEALSVTGYAKVSEFSVNYHVEFEVAAADGTMLLASKTIDMSREFTYDRAQALGTATREEQIRKSLVDDMVQAILRRLQAARDGGVQAN
ncbi:MAG TPA: LPS assembly lipoprotein LptE [Rhodanobacteraceae bacterium]|nr:LPS assembly lipoprotein LptE [Rhodanobacteraceae bacterium]